VFYVGRKRPSITVAPPSERLTRSRYPGNPNAAGGGGGVITGNTLEYIRKQDAKSSESEDCCCGCKNKVGKSFHKCLKCRGRVFAGICFIDGGENGVNGTCFRCAGKKR
jgi:hypothetical protein